jgi:hypothetical protein
MSQIVLDDQLDVVKVLPGLRRWVSAVRLQELRPGQHILDDRVPEILLTCRQPTFATIDADFWKPSLRHLGYCIAFVDVDFRRQQEVPGLLRQLFRHPAFASRAQRMGKVIRLNASGIWYWEVGAPAIKQTTFGLAPKKRRRKT